MSVSIIRNSCKCAKCGTILVSEVDGPEGEITCGCGAITASGGTSAINRRGDPSKCEELSRWEVLPPLNPTARKANTIRRHIRELSTSDKWRIYASLASKYPQPELLDKYEIATFVDRVVDYYDEGWLAEIYDEVLKEGKALLSSPAKGALHE